MLDIRGKFKFITQRLKKEGHVFREKIVFQVTNEICLHLKGNADIFFDRIWDIYGMNSQEAAAFEAVVITGSSKFVQEKLREFGYVCPFIFVHHHILAIDEIAYFLENPSEMKRRGKACYNYVKRVHNGELAVRNLMKLIKE